MPARCSLLAGVLACLLAAPGAAALSAVNAGGPDTVRLIAEEGPVTVRALDGQPGLDGDPVPRKPVPLERELVPWRGYERTVEVTVTGTGRLLVADDASGVVLEPAGNASGAGAGDAEGPQPASGTERTAPPEDAKDANASTATAGTAGGAAGQSTGSPATGAAPHRSGPAATPAAGEDDTGSVVGWISQHAAWLGLAGALAVGLAPVAWRWGIPRLRGAPGGDPPAAMAPPRGARRPSWAPPPGPGGEKVNPRGRHARRGRSPEDVADPRRRGRAPARRPRRRDRARARQRDR